MLTRLRMTVDWMRCQVMAFRKEELGGGELIAVVIVVVVVIALGVAFSANITGMFNSLWDGATDGTTSVDLSTTTDATDKLA